jgi:hypothetical protein
MITVYLLDREKEQVAELRVDSATILEVTTLVFEGKHYAFMGLAREVRYFNGFNFMECKPPVVIPYTAAFWDGEDHRSNK